MENIEYKVRKTYFISGHEDFTKDDFIRFYVPLIKQAILEDAYFVVGDRDGVDVMAQMLLSNALSEKDLDRVKVFFKGDVPTNFVNPGFMAIGNFVSDEEANVAMTLCSDEDIVCLEESKRASLTADNILRRYTPKFNFKSWADAKQRNVRFWDAIFYNKVGYTNAEA